MLPTLLFALGCYLVHVFAQRPPAPADENLTGTAFLNHDTPLAPYTGKQFLKANVPYIDVPDQTIQAVYYYRFYALAHHLLYATQGTGFTITEFIDIVGYSGAFNSINAAAGHQLEEARWLRSTFYAEDFLQIWTRGPGMSAQYTHWIHDAAVGNANVTGNSAFIISQLDGLVAMWHEWDYVFNPTLGLYWYTPEFDAQERSLPGWIANSITGDPDIIYHGPNTYRPSHNAYMAANAKAISTVAYASGKVSLAKEYAQKAQALKTAIETHLWNSTQKWFVDYVKEGEPGAGQVDGRELVGSFPFRYGIGLSEKFTKPTLEALADPKSFNTTFWPPTLEVQNKYYDPNVTGCCWWNGQNWPYSTAHTTQSLAAMARSGLTTPEYYVNRLHNYAMTQYKNGMPFVAESHFPVRSAPNYTQGGRDGWSQDADNHSDHYLHSTFINNVITGLLGIQPRADNVLELKPIIPAAWSYFALENLHYHGMLLTILYDKHGSRYGQGTGLTVFANGVKIHTQNTLHATVSLPSPYASTEVRLVDVNIACNPKGQGYWPRASATTTWELDSPYQAIDGELFYDADPAHNRWTNYRSDKDNHSQNPNDTLTIQLQRPRNMSGVALAIFSDVAQTSSGAVDCPSAILITDAKGKTLAHEAKFGAKCMPNEINVITFAGVVEADTLHINFFGRNGHAVGASEVQIWVPANSGPTYLAADAIPSDSALVAFDSASTATPNGAVMAVGNSTAVTAFSGIFSPKGGAVAAKLRYKNTGSGTVQLGITLNKFVAAGNITLAKTTRGYKDVDMPSLGLLRGTNFVTVYGGGNGVFLEGITVGQAEGY